MIFLQRYLLVTLAILASGFAMGQDVFNKKNAPKKALKKYEKLKSISGKDKLAKKEQALDKLLEKFPGFVDPYIDRAYIYYQQGNISDARQDVETAISLDSLYKADSYLILANYCKELLDVVCEKENLLLYVANTKSTKRKAVVQERIINLKYKEQILADYEAITLDKLPATINTTEHAEYKPVLSVDSKHMIFTRRLNGQEDFYESYLVDSSWTEAVAIEELNTEGNEGAHAISADNKWIIFTKCDAPKRYRSCDLYIAKNNNGIWGEAKYMANVNTESWESQASFSPDGNTIYYSSAKEGGKGAKDLYFIELKNGSWSDPQNLGDVINTKRNEESPYMHPDGQTLYFMSDGLPGLGGTDLFLTTRQFDGSWSEPINMGGAINSIRDEGGLFVGLQGERAYFSKTEKIDGKISSDIYSFVLPEKFRPEPSTYIRFVLRDAATKKRIDAEITVMEINSKRERTEKISEKGMTMIVSKSERYNILIDKQGYIFHSEKVQFLDPSSKMDPKTYEILLDKIPVKEAVVQDTLAPVTLENVEFNSGEATLLAESYNELDKLVELMVENPSMDILLNGHTDNVGNEEDNVILSRQRAESVQNYLLKYGVDKGRISIQAFGESRAISSNDTEDGRAVNRRIEFLIIYRK
ncbi:OmpA family protein [Saprospiraceae bacterium]|nr:OmpA family protein [Saprospiraceae bacterium]